MARPAPYQKPASLILHTTIAFARGSGLPRMGKMREELPDIDLWLDTSQRAVDFEIDEVDILIHQLHDAARVSAEATLFFGIASGNSAAVPLLDRATQHNNIVYPPAETRARFTTEAVYTSEELRVCTRVWQKSMSGR